ncbi:ferredoxin [Mycobacterium sp. AMU20-3851]|uniref:ferredoxin n=1 Tax=Mycobacterium sp. AMU20-3851 TaxID=3122055 RepID=UPI0037552573
MVTVDPKLCEGHALCLDTAPEVFDVGDDDVASCLQQPSPALWPAVRAAIDACPRGAISIREEQPERTQP